MDFRLSNTELVLRELCERLKAQRLGQNLTQESVAKRAGISTSALKRLETGDNVRMLTLLNVAKVLGVIDGLAAAFQWTAPVTISELERREAARPRMRARPSGAARSFKAKESSP